MSLFRIPSFSAALSTQVLMSAAIFSAAFLLSQFFQLGLGNSPLGTGLRFLPWTATPLFVVPLARALFDRVGARPLVVPGLAMQGLGFVWIVHLAGAGAGYGRYVIPFLIAGVGNSLALPCVATAALNAVPPPSLSKAAGILNTLQQLGAVFGIAVATAVFNAHGSLTSPAAISHGFRPALAVSATASILGALAALAIRPHPGMGLSGGK